MNKKLKNNILFTAILVYFIITGNVRAQLPVLEKDSRPTGQAPQEQQQMAISYARKLNIKELPSGIVASVNENYPGFKILNAFKGTDGSFKIKMGKGTEKAVLYYNEEEKFQRLEDESTHKEDDEIH